jgi:histidyl-tRNA synthetase
MAPSSNKSAKSIQPPKGTRDLYPDDVLKRRYIQNAWRDASLRCGFDEIEGPTFETSDLYSIKSGEGILSELFQTFSGKGGQETLDKLVAKGKADFALRPEFTPTLARMYAARAKQLPKPCKWFTAGPYFRAERPQRGRLREFLQWNCDIIGLPSDEDTPQTRAQMDAETIECCVVLMESLGLSSSDCTICFNDRKMLSDRLSQLGVLNEQIDSAMVLLDKREKLPIEKLKEIAVDQGLSSQAFLDYLTRESKPVVTSTEVDIKPTTEMTVKHDQGSVSARSPLEIIQYLDQMDLLDWSIMDLSIVRGLAYYTGTVFEAIAEGERAVAGGGRYDNLIELMGGPPTPAVGFAMGDVVLTNLLEDNNLIPEGQELMEAVAKPQASIRPQAFIAVPNNDEENRAAAQSLAATLRRGQESETYLTNESRKPWDANRYTIPPLHTRISYKSTANPGKLRKDADSQHAKYFIEIHAPNKVELTDMDKRESITSPTHGSFSVNPTDENYIGTALKNLT